MIINKEITEEINKVSEIAGYLWERGWSERNAGNISINLTDFIDDLGVFDVTNLRYTKCDFPEEAKNLLIFITGAGARLRELRTIPEKAAGIILIDENAKGFFQVWGGKQGEGFKPTSEYISHILIHLENIKKNNFKRAILHTHPIELIALSHNPIINSDENKFNNALWGMLPEVRVYVPNGISLAPYFITGSKQLADITITGLENRDVVLWNKHGTVSCGKDIVEAFDYLDVANKGAYIYLTCLQAGYVPEGLNEKQLIDLERLFNL